MSIIAPTEHAAKRVVHVESHLDGGFDIDEMIFYIESNTGNPKACLLGLSSHALARAISAWFSHHDLKSMRQWGYVASKLDQEYYKRSEETHSAGAKLLQLLKPLLSNNPKLIDWFAHCDWVYDLGRAENTKTHDFWAYQAVVALRGEWDRLEERCERLFRDPPRASSEQKYQVDHQFWLALARREVGRMQDVLQELVSPKARRARSNSESGFTDDLVSTSAVVYAKIAWFHGYEVQVDTPYIPAEWLPMQPLGHYDNHYAFLQPAAEDTAV